MYIDSRLEFSDAQALTATAASTNVIDLSSDRDIGSGQPLWLVVQFDVALAGTTPTFQAALQTDDNAAFSSATTLISGEQLSSAAAGTRQVLAIPFANEQFLRVNYTLGGTTPTATVSAWLTSEEPVKHAAYPDAI